MPVERGVEEHWPHLAALTRTLEALTSGTVTVGTATQARSHTSGSQEEAARIADMLERHQQRGGKVPWR